MRFALNATGNENSSLPTTRSYPRWSLPMVKNKITPSPTGCLFKADQSLSDKVSDFADENFWGAYNIIEPTESLENAVYKLKKQHKKLTV